MEAVAENRLLVVWQDIKTRHKHPIGELTKGNGFVFQYNVDELQKSRLNYLTAFPDSKKAYHSKCLFPAFSSRLPDKRRSDMKEILSSYKMDSYDEFELLKRSGGKLPTDFLEFVEPIVLSDKIIKRQFYIAGTTCNENKEAIMSLKPQMTLQYQLEPENEIDKDAIQILTQGKVIGYIPTYFSKDVTDAVNSGRVIQIRVLDVKSTPVENLHELVKVELVIE